MDYKNTALAEIQILADAFPEYSAGQSLLAITKMKPEDKTLGEWLMEVSDEDLYTAIENARLREE